VKNSRFINNKNLMKDLKNKYQEQFSQEFYGRNLFRTQEEEFLDAPKEECGIFGLYSDNEVDTFSLSQFGLFALQHRQKIKSSR